MARTAKRNATTRSKAKASEEKMAAAAKAIYPPGHWMGLGISMGIPVGIPIGLLAGFSAGDLPMGMAIGPAFGVAIGSGIGWTLERRHAGQVRKFTPGERSLTKKLELMGVGALAVGVAMLAYFVFF